MTFYLYMYTHKESNKSYIGATNNLKRRKKEHRGGYSHALAFNGAMNKYNEDTFDFHVLAILDNRDEVCRMEREAIKAFRTLAPNGYNLNEGSPGTEYQGPHSEETRNKIGNANKGKVRSPEFRQKISEKNKGKSISLEIRKKLSLAKKGKQRSPFSLECRQKMSEIHKNISPETRHKMSVSQKGRKQTLETRYKISFTNKDKPKTSEHCHNLSISMKYSSRAKKALGEVHFNKIGIPQSQESRQKISDTMKIVWINRKENEAKQTVVDKV
jgi:group I intron endonuclease